MNHQTKPIKVMVIGAPGKMGQEACLALRQHPSFEVSAKLGRGDDLKQHLTTTQCDVVVELSNAESVMRNARCVLDHNKPLVIGASGLSPSDIDELTATANAKQIGTIIAPNFSIGAILMMHFAKIAAPFMKHAEIIEAHHPNKIDAPSGTALKTAALLAPHISSPPDSSTQSNPSRGLMHDTIPIHSIRTSGVIANQTVAFGNPGEQLTIEHRTLDRSSFMPGLLLACEKVLTCNQLIYGLESLVFSANTTHEKNS